MKTKKKPTIVINGRKYAPSLSAFLETLFQTNGTASGEYRVLKGGILLLDLQQQPFAFVVNRGIGKWIVTATRDEKGRTVYMQGLSSLTANRLGMPENMLNASQKLAEDIVSQVNQ